MKMRVLSKVFDELGINIKSEREKARTLLLELAASGEVRLWFKRDKNKVYAFNTLNQTSDITDKQPQYLSLDRVDASSITRYNKTTIHTVLSGFTKTPNNEHVPCDAGVNCVWKLSQPVVVGGVNLFILDTHIDAFKQEYFGEGCYL